jgi:hypothetical protein
MKLDSRWIRRYFYLLAGICSALLGWNIAQALITDLGIGQEMPELVLFPCVALSLAVGMVINEIFLSNPTRPWLNLRISILPLCIGAGLGAGFGLITAAIALVLFNPNLQVPNWIVRVLGWMCIGISTGLAEGLTWRWRSIEAGNRHRFRRRFRTSLIAASTAGCLAALIFEAIRLSLGQFPRELAGLEDPLGFTLLGAVMGLVFSCTSSPSYLVALRAGAGFEYTEWEDESHIRRTPTVHELTFVSNSETDHIEEGLSIELPTNGKIVVGGDPMASISMPGLPNHVADIELSDRDSILVPLQAQTVSVNGQRLAAHQRTLLKHNSVLTFYAEDSQAARGKKFYRLVYYNRFLDPQA